MSWTYQHTSVCTELSVLRYFMLRYLMFTVFHTHYWGADKSLARPWKETSYNDQDLQHYNKTYGI